MSRVERKNNESLESLGTRSILKFLTSLVVARNILMTSSKV